MPAKTKTQTTHSQGLFRLPIFLLLIAFAIGFCTHLLFTVIFAETKSGDMIHACANKRSGELRVITNYKDYREGKLDRLRKDNKEDTNGCRESEFALEWNKQGPVGPAGQSTSQGSSLPYICIACSYEEYLGDSFADKNLSHAIMPLSSVYNANFTGTNFSNANLRQSEFHNVNFSKANFENTNLLGTRFKDSKFEEVQWNNTICPDGSNSNDHSNTCEGYLTPKEE